MAESGRLHRGATLPYKLLAGVEPCPGGWLVVIGRLQGITLAPLAPQVIPTLTEILDYKPAFTVVALHAPIGLPATAVRGGRTCDRFARKVLGANRGAGIASPPLRAAIDASTYDEARAANGGHLSPVVWNQMPRIAEVAREMQPYWQRMVYEVNPELAFYDINDEVPLSYPKHEPEGRKERRNLLEYKMHGIERVLDQRVKGARPHHIVDAVADLWTARKIAARAVHRLPEDPEWDDLALRMEILW